MSKSVGDYVLRNHLGKGNYADVYLGQHKQTKERFAIKVVAKKTFAEPKLFAGLEAEIKIMKDVHHVNLLTLVKYFSSENNFYLVTEYCAGGDLSVFLRKKGRLSEETAFFFLAQLTEGLACLHEHNFLHRDLKPANVLLTECSERATLKIADFGFARNLGGALMAQTRCGTPLYMAPEILEARDYDAKADVWSVGCIFFEMLFNTYPYSGVNEGDLLKNIRTKALRAPTDAQVSQVALDIISKLLERQVSRRASTTQLLTIMRQLQKTQQEELPSGSVAATNALSPTDTTAEEFTSSKSNAPSSSTLAVSQREKDQSAVLDTAESEKLRDDDDYDVVCKEDAISPLSSRTQASSVAVPPLSTTTANSYAVPAAQITARRAENGSNAPENASLSAKGGNGAANNNNNVALTDTDVLPFAERLGEEIQSLLSFADRLVDVPSVRQTLTLMTAASPTLSPNLTPTSSHKQAMPTTSTSTTAKIFSSSFSTTTYSVPHGSSTYAQTTATAATTAKDVESLEALLLSLRIHVWCLSILKGQLEERERKALSTNGYASFPTLQFLLQEMWSMYHTVLYRYERLCELTEWLLTTQPSLRNTVHADVQIETLLFQEAQRGEENGTVEDVLGHTEKSLGWFTYARGLMSAVPPASLTGRLISFMDNLERKIQSTRQKEQAMSVLLH